MQMRVIRSDLTHIHTPPHAETRAKISLQGNCLTHSATPSIHSSKPYFLTFLDICLTHSIGTRSHPLNSAWVLCYWTETLSVAERKRTWLTPQNMYASHCLRVDAVLCYAWHTVEIVGHDSAVAWIGLIRSRLICTFGTAAHSSTAASQIVLQTALMARSLRTRQTHAEQSERGTLPFAPLARSRMSSQAPSLRHHHFAFPNSPPHHTAHKPHPASIGSSHPVNHPPSHLRNRSTL